MGTADCSTLFYLIISLWQSDTIILKF